VKFRAAQPMKKFPIFYGISRLSTVSKTARQRRFQELHETSPQTATPSPRDPVYYHSSIYAYVFRAVSSFQDFQPQLHTHFTFSPCELQNQPHLL
jgi:hypothetical protein